MKYCTWKYNHKGGFYWAGAYASKDYLVFGSDDGAENDYTNTAILYSVNTHTGLLIDQKTGLKGDIRSTIVYQNGYVYFTTKGGYLYRIAMNQNGTFGQTDSISLGGMATASPVVYKGRIYVGVCGTGGQFNPDGGHHFAVLTETSSGLSLAYNVSIPGYPQAAPLMSTAYENRDYNGDGLPDGRVYLYFTYNAKPGGIYMLTDAPGQTSGTAAEIFRPEKDQAEYCISTICADRDGTLYFKNDSNYLMAVECNGAYIDSVTAQSDAGTIKWKDMFRKSKTEHTLLIGEETKTVTLQFKALDGCTLSVNGQNITGAYTVDVSSGQAEVQVLAQCLGKSRKYVFHITRDQSVPSLANLTVSTSNTYSNVQARLAISPAFDRNTAEYRVLYTGNRDFINIFAETEESDAEVTAAGIQGTLKVSIFGKTTGSGNASRIAIYLDKSPEIQEAKVRITVRTRTGKTGDYILTIQRKEIIVTPTPTPVPDEPEVFGTWSTLSPATVFEPEVQQRTGSKGTVQTRTVGEKLSPTGKLNVKRIPLKIRQTTSKVSVSGLANGDLVKTWTSSNRKIVSVSKKGVIKGLRKGKATVTAVLASGKKLSLTVTVQAKTVKTKSITGLKGKLTLKRKGKLALKPVLSPITSQEKVSYMSSNSKIVAVNKRGVITGKKKGSAKITVKSGKKRKVIRVTVR
ncbi:MAG: Ig-like domain-containing protein [Blautia sp.]